MNPILDKIKKLLRMKRGGTPAEIETALAMARALAAKHGIDINTVDPAEDERAQSELSHHDTKHARAIHYDTRYAARVCEKFFNVAINETRSWKTDYRASILQLSLLALKSR